VAEAGFEAEPTGREVRFAGAGEILVDARPELLYRALENLVRNAVKFAPEGTAVEVEVTRRVNPERAVATVADRGPGVPEKHLEAIFEPFFRSTSSTGTGGFGLGLAIARRAVAAHRGAIRASNRAGGGLLVEIVLPAAPVPAPSSRPANSSMGRT
jgi:two-component system, OmpR family, sensor kinase